MADILINNMEMPKGDVPLVIIINSDGSVEEIDGSDEINATDAKAIELPPHERTDLDLYEYIKQGSSFIKLNIIASELSFLIHCEKEKKIKDVLGRLVAIRNAIWDSVTLESN